jgi:hypothetical protein
LEGFWVVLVLFKKLLDSGFGVRAGFDISGIGFRVARIVVRDN